MGNCPSWETDPPLDSPPEENQVILSRSGSVRSFSLVKGLGSRIDIARHFVGSVLRIEVTMYAVSLV